MENFSQNLPFSNLQVSPIQYHNNEDTIDTISNANSQPTPLPLFHKYSEDDFIQMEYLGKGGNANVYKVYHKQYNRFVAMKQIPLNEAPPYATSHHKRIIMETSILTRIVSIKDPLISRYYLNYYETYQDNVNLYIEMEPGLMTLHELMDAGRRFSNNETIYILYTLVKSLRFLEIHGIVSRDIKPSNVMLTTTDYPHIYDFKIYDFGIGFLMEPNEKLVHPSTFLGYTPDYVAPEVLQALHHTN